MTDCRVHLRENNRCRTDEHRGGSWHGFDDGDQAGHSVTVGKLFSNKQRLESSSNAPQHANKPATSIKAGWLIRSF